MQESLFTSGKDDWNTPPEVLARVRLVGPIGFDPCWNPSSLTCPRQCAWLEKGQDGLQLDWAELVGPGEVVFVNPPFSTLQTSWGWKIAAEGPRVAARGAHLVALVPARTDTRWWQPMWEADAICFWRGRIRFLTAGKRQTGSPFPSAFLYWGESDGRRPSFERAFSARGRVIVPGGARPVA